MNMRISDPYVVYINNTDKTYVLRNRCYLPLGESDDRQFVRFKYDETIYLYNDGSKPWESKTHKKVYKIIMICHYRIVPTLYLNIFIELLLDLVL